LAFADEREPPREVWYSLEEALELLAALEDARDAHIHANQLAVVIPVESDVRKLSRRLGVRRRARRRRCLMPHSAPLKPPVGSVSLPRSCCSSCRASRFVTSSVDGIAHVPAAAVEEYHLRTAP
jgi:hypothetical protein